MIGQRSGDARCRCVCWDDLGIIEDDGTVPLELEAIWKAQSKGLDQIRVAVEVHCVLLGIRLPARDTNRSPVFGAGRDVGRLAPLERLLQLAHSIRSGRRREDEFAQSQKIAAQRRRVGIEDLCNRGALEWPRSLTMPL